MKISLRRPLARGGFVKGALTAAVATAFSERATANPTLELKVVTVLVDTASQSFYADDLGFYRKSGIDAKTAIVNSGAAEIPAIVAGTFDIGCSTIGSIAQAVERGLPLTIIAAGAMYDTVTPTTVIFVRAKDSIRSAKDLNGKTIGVNGLSDLIYVASRNWIVKNGGDIDSMKFVEIPFSAQGPTLQRGIIDAVAGGEPSFSIARLHNDARAIAYPYDLVNGRKPFMISAWFSKSDWAEANPDSVKRFSSVIYETARWANKNQARSAAILGKYVTLEPDVLKSMARCRFATSLSESPIQPALNIYYEAKLLPKLIDAATLLYRA